MWYRAVRHGAVRSISMWSWWLSIVRTIRSAGATDRLQYVSEGEGSASGVHVGAMEAELETGLEIPVEEERRLPDVRIFGRMQLRSGESRVSGGVRRQCND